MKTLKILLASSVACFLSLVQTRDASASDLVLQCDASWSAIGKRYKIEFDNSDGDEPAHLSRTISRTVGQEYSASINFKYIEAALRVSESDEVSATCGTTVGAHKSKTLMATVTGTGYSCRLVQECSLFNPGCIDGLVVKKGLYVFIPDGIRCTN